MQLAHLILCHANPGQVGRLIKSLAHRNAHIYIHVDKKADITPFLQLAEHSGVYFIEKREKVYWGGYSMVQATINGFQQILSSGIKYDYINLLSGQDYPLKSAAEIQGFLAANPGKAFMNSLSSDRVAQEMANRVKQYYFAELSFKGKYTAERIVKTLFPRRFPQGFEIVCQSQWFTMPSACATYIVDFLKNNSGIKRSFRHMWAPDEIALQSILHNSPFRNNIVCSALRYEDWSEGKPSPKLLTMADAEKLTASGKYFARKFDNNTDSRILDYLDGRHAAVAV
jgi:hypothetical protein